MKKVMRSFCSGAVFACIAMPCLSQSISLYSPATSAISTLTYSVSGSVLTVSATWLSDSPSFLSIGGLADSTIYTLKIEHTNNSSTAWTRVAYELLDPVGDTNDSQDVLPYPAFVPAGYSTSNDEDGVSFAQGQSVARTSTVFTAVQADELSDRRDFLDFSNGVQSVGATDTYTRFGLRDTGPVSQNQPFLLSIRPNAVSPVPESSSLWLMSVGCLVLIARRASGARQRRSVGKI